MTETPTDVLVAGYKDMNTATADFESLTARVKGGSVEIDGVILVTHAVDGSVSVRQTGDHLGRRGAGWGGGVGVAMGLFAPPLLASAAVGAVAGGVVGKFVDHRMQSEIHEKIGENLPPGSAGSLRCSTTSSASRSSRHSEARSSARSWRARRKGSRR